MMKAGTCRREERWILVLKVGATKTCMLSQELPKLHNSGSKEKGLKLEALLSPGRTHQPSLQVTGCPPHLYTNAVSSSWEHQIQFSGFLGRFLPASSAIQWKFQQGCMVVILPAHLFPLYIIYLNSWPKQWRE